MVDSKPKLFAVKANNKQPITESIAINILLGCGVLFLVMSICQTKQILMIDNIHHDNSNDKVIKLKN